MAENVKTNQIIRNLKDIEVLPQTLQNAFENIANGEGYISCNITIRSLDSVGNNFLGEITLIDIKGETESDQKETNIFLKQKSCLNKVICLSVDDIYRREEFFYKKLATLFKLLQADANVPEDERYKLPKAYNETSSDAIILENLVVKGFTTYNRVDVMPLKFMQLSIQQIAKLHGLSFVIEQKMPDYHEKKIKVLKHPFTYDEEWKEIIQKICTYVADFCDSETKDKFEKFTPIFLDKYSDLNNDKTSTKCALTHGGLRSSNILVRELDGEPVECVLIDYQFLDYGCPMRDLIFFIIAHTDQAFRRKHMSDLKQLYFDTLSNYLKYFDMDVETVYPKKDFENAFVEWMDYGLMRILFCLPFMFAPDTGVDIQNVRLVDIPICLDKSLKDRIHDLIKDFVEWGYLK